MTETIDPIQLWGAGCFGAMIGWQTYSINRYRKAELQLSDLAALIGAIGGAAVLALFPARSALFGAYGIGLASGFFTYFLVLVALVSASKNFRTDWFLDGRRKKLKQDEFIDPSTAGTVHPMGLTDLTPPSSTHED